MSRCKSAFNLSSPFVRHEIEAVNIVERAMQEHGDLGELCCDAESERQWEAGQSTATLSIYAEGTFSHGGICNASAAALRNLADKLEAAARQIETWPVHCK